MPGNSKQCIVGFSLACLTLEWNNKKLTRYQAVSTLYSRLVEADFPPLMEALRH